jgi:hypothetical protein
MNRKDLKDIANGVGLEELRKDIKKKKKHYPYNRP